jgi:hypothetical protein
MRSSVRCANSDADDSRIWPERITLRSGQQGIRFGSTIEILFCQNADVARFRDVDGVQAGGWLAADLNGASGKVSSRVPRNFEDYARIFHPAVRPDGSLVRWAEVATELGRTMHPLAQWHLIVGARDSENLSDSKWSGGHPSRGDMDPSSFKHLCDVLAQFTTTPELCYIGIWTGLAWQTTRQFSGDDDGSQGSTLVRDGQSALSEGETNLRVLEAPPGRGRSYRIVAGPLSEADKIRDPDEVYLSPTSPNLLWPADRSWCLATEIDFDSTIVGGSAQMVESIRRVEELEASRIGVDDSLTAKADRINRTSG